MRIFGENMSAELNTLRQQLEACEVQRKALAGQLAEERKNSAKSVIEIEKAAAEVQAAKSAVQKMRARQKNSVERANRLKARLVGISSQGV